MKFCTKCGTQVPDDAHFCISCGEPQNPAAAAPKATAAAPSDGASPSPVMPAAPALPGKKRLSGCAIAAIVTGSLGLLGIIFILGLWFLATSLTADVVKAAEDYLATLNRGQTREAYEMSAAALRKETSLAQFNKVVAQFPLLNHYTAFKVNSRNLQNEIGTVSGEISDASGKRAELEFILVKENGVWRVLSLHVKMIALQETRDAGYEKRLVDSSFAKRNAPEVVLWS